MKKELMEILVCPQCKGELKLSIDTESNDEVVTGSLHCSLCNTSYPIESTIPCLLPAEIRIRMSSHSHMGA